MASSVTATELAIKKLDEQLTCAICLDSYKNPKLLNCFHVFCTQCLQPLVHQAVQGQTVQCPNCRQLTTLPQNGVPGLQGAFHVYHLFDIRDTLKKVVESPDSPCEKCKRESAVKFCRDCNQFICATCVGIHRSWAELSSHEVVTIKQLTRNVRTIVAPKKPAFLCKRHPKEELDLFCETCEELVCRDCVAGAHREHRCGVVANAFPKQRETLLVSLQPMEQQLAAVDRALEGVEARCGRVTDERQAIAAQIERDVCQIHVALEQRKQELLRQLELLMQHKIKTLTLQRERFELVGAQRKSCRDFVQESLRTGNQAEILGMKKRVVQKIEEIIASFDPKSLALHEEADIKFTENLREMIQSCQHFGRVYAQQLCPEKCSVSAPAAMAALVGETSTATLRAIDSEEQEWMEDIEEVSSELVSSDGSTRVSAAITKRGGNEYEINYRPQRRGRHQLHIRVDRNHVSGSPLSVVAHPKDLSVIRTIEGQYPRQVAFNRSGEMIVTEYRGHCVSVFSVDGVRIRTFGSKGSGLGELNEPHGITTDAQGNILVCDKGNHRIQKYAHDGANPQLIGMHGAGPLQFKGPYSIAVHPHTKKVYVADTFNCRIQVLNEDLSFSFSFGKQGSGKGEFESPCSIAFDGNGQLYVAEYKNRRIQVFSEHNQYLRAFGKELKSPVSIAIHGGVVYVTDHDGKSVALYTTDGEHVRSFQPFDGKPHGITVKDNGEIFVCYGFNDCIVVC